jgi:hypothetical protein
MIFLSLCSIKRLKLNTCYYWFVEIGKFLAPFRTKGNENTCRQNFYMDPSGCLDIDRCKNRLFIEIHLSLTTAVEWLYGPVIVSYSFFLVEYSIFMFTRTSKDLLDQINQDNKDFPLQSNRQQYENKAPLFKNLTSVQYTDALNYLQFFTLK